MLAYVQAHEIWATKVLHDKACKDLHLSLQSNMVLRLTHWGRPGAGT